MLIIHSSIPAATRMLAEPAAGALPQENGFQATNSLPEKTGEKGKFAQKNHPSK
jgi:hypothetical protein